ncbi:MULTISPECIES: 50S ribosomal protein L25/general stress protein Ctc [unclassified Brevundimonas]|uniref:50S ribosomal protein L25/general stress protein Ctc n=1 Tax=unclassified Brevundimonas TaxID=2622653 RepID=UPI000CFC996D|nr:MULTISPECIES: 50S ribosomal protein L25/general stress protein Ctc [unclassified Brevundimonas]PRA19303.1 50S ribosomal protein L25/general stress protein Ctc [Brevundimonas sp. MYb27]PQZ74062.1 50S ribosomal protein L25/general stress protein Ctc [Brevundimonas sp. MYb31]PRB10808.1 50S ribosomal protein L25/general stress protein Ctc [Brevundimonas sp. MYb52]PRB32404.1 50S ribosomal protein L25/general stress protein Ctc [Brevundimonas sp. MYb46]PRB50295.1 50S ribosomal protein L25/general
MAEIILNVDVREGAGTGSARAVRRSGAVPGILYGGDKAPVSISVNEKDFRKSLYTGKLLGHLVTLKYGEETQPVIAKTVQFDPVSDRPLHFDLMRVDAKAPLKIEIAVHFKNADEAPFSRAGGMLEVVRHSVEILVAADQIPEELVVDLTGREVGETIRMSDIVLPKGASATITDRDFVIATIKNSAAGQSDAGDTTVEAEA